MLSPRVSIIIPCFNGEEYVEDAIQSALNQTYANKEVIVIDDGSTDKSLKIIQSFGDTVRWRTGPNQGAGAARNRGIEMSRGDFIQFLDSDDVLLEDCVECKVGASANDDEVVVSDWETIDENGKRISNRPAVGVDPVLALMNGHAQTSCPLHRITILKTVGGFDSNLPCCQERDLHLRIVCEGVKFKRIPQVLHRVFRRQGSVSSNYTRVLLTHERIFSRAIGILRESGRLSKERTRVFAEALAKEGRYLYHHGEKESATRYFRIAVGLDHSGAMSAYRNPFIRFVARLKGQESAEKFVSLMRRYNHGKSKV